MDTKAQLRFCKKCKNESFDKQLGTICSLTNELPTFETTCPNYKNNFFEIYGFLTIPFTIVIFLIVIGWYVLSAIAGVLTIIIIIGTKKEHIKSIKKKGERQAGRERHKEKINNIIIPTYNKSRAELIDKYGNPSKEFSFGLYDINKEIIAFEKSKRIWILGKDFPMKSILECKFTHSKKVEKGDIISLTKTNNTNMATRAVIGGILTGGVGAVVGGATAKKTTVSKQSNDKVYHNYTIVITIDSLSEPIIRIPMHSDSTTTTDIVAMMNVIINRKY